MSNISTFRNNRTPRKNSSSSRICPVVFRSCSTTRKGGRGSCTVQGPLSDRTCTGRGGGYGSGDHEPHGSSVRPPGRTLSGTCANKQKNHRSISPARTASSAAGSVQQRAPCATCRGKRGHRASREYRILDREAHVECRHRNIE
jgi:hypothetical protein